MDYSWDALILWALTSLPFVQSDSGICQVYSYNVQSVTSVETRGRLREKHLFVCCENSEPSCKGISYQKLSSRHHDFCHGDLPDDVTHGRHGSSSLVHWVQRESFPVLPGRGALYCGDCCGQQLAQKTCDHRFEKHHKDGCFNWVQCFMEECKRVYEKVGAHEELGCELPPAPYPKHFHPDPHTLPPSSHQLSTTSGGPTANVEVACSDEGCHKLPMLDRCRKDCCEDHCCLPDGLVESHKGGLPFDFSPGQLAGLTLSTLLAIVILAMLVVFVSRKCRRRWRLTRVPQKDTQGLVIEEDEEDEQESDAVDLTA